MSLTPDYFISSCGYPKLNREKYKLSSVIKQKQQLQQRQQQQQQQQQQRKSRQLITATDNLIDTRNTRNVLKFNCCDMIFDNNNNNNGILLTKRRLQNNPTFLNNNEELTTITENIRHNSCNCNYNSVHNNSNNNSNDSNIQCNWNWVSDKEMKCFVNERIKERNKKYNRKEIDKQKQNNPYHNNNVR